MGRKMAYVSGGMKARLQSSVRASRRSTVYRMLAKRNDGTVPCYVCGLHVEPKHATLEHVIPVSKGGTDDMDNLSISHRKCNQRRGADMPSNA